MSETPAARDMQHLLQEPQTIPAAAGSWHIVAAMVASLAVGLGAMSQYVFGLFIGPVVEDTGWAASTVSGAVALFLGMSAIGVASLGVLIDRFGPRRPALASILLCAVTIMGASQAGSGPLFAAMLGLAGLSYGAGTGIAFSQVIASRFTRRRGLALGIGTAGTGVGGMLLPQYATFLLAHLGWRESFLAIGATIACVAVPAALVGLPKRSRRDRIDASGGGSAALRAIGSRTFLILAGAVCLASCASLAMMVHAVGLMTSRGFSLPEAASVMSAVALASVVGRTTGGYFLDIYFAPFVAAFIFALAALCAVGALLAPAPAMVIACFVTFGFVAGAEGDVIPYMVSRYFDPSVFARCFGFLIFLFMIAGGLGVFTAGWLLDRSGQYAAALIFVASLSVGAALLILRIGPYRAD